MDEQGAVGRETGGQDQHDQERRHGRHQHHPGHDHRLAKEGGEGHPGGIRDVSGATARRAGGTQPADRRAHQDPRPEGSGLHRREGAQSCDQVSGTGTTLVNTPYAPQWRIDDPALTRWKVEAVRAVDALTASWTSWYVAISETVK